MSIKITSISEALENNGIKILVHGLAGAGKTVFCATTGMKTLIISAESGLLSIAGAPSYIQTTVVKTIHELEKVYEFLEDNPDEYKCVALDSISEIAEVLLADEKKNSKDPRQAYGNLSDRMLNIMRGFRDLPNINVIMSCKQVRIKDDDTGITRYVPSLPGQALTNAIGYLFDEVFVLRVEKDEDGNDYRILQTGRDRNFEAKDRSGVLEMFEKPSAKHIFDKIRDGHPDEEVETNENKHKISDKETEEKHAEKAENIESNIDDEEKAEEAGEKGKEARGKTELEAEEKVEKVEEKVEKVEEIEEAIEEEEKEKIILNDSKKVMYLYHSESDSILKLPVGDEIEDDGCINIISFKEYTEHKKRLIKED